MKPAVHDLTITRGSTRPITLRFKTKPAGGEKAVMSLQGVTVQLVFRWPGGGFTKSSADGGITVDVAAGSATWSPTRKETLSIPQSRVAEYFWQLITPDGGADTYLEGYVEGKGNG